MFSQCIKIHKLIFNNLSWYCTALCALVSAQMGLRAHWWSVGAEGQARQRIATLWWHESGGSRSMSCAGLNVACKPQRGHAWLNRQGTPFLLSLYHSSLSDQKQNTLVGSLCFPILKRNTLENGVKSMSKCFSLCYLYSVFCRVYYNG